MMTAASFSSVLTDIAQFATHRDVPRDQILGRDPQVENHWARCIFIKFYTGIFCINWCNSFKFHQHRFAGSCGSTGYFLWFSFLILGPDNLLGDILDELCQLLQNTGLLKKKYTFSKMYFTITSDAKSMSCVRMERKFLKSSDLNVRQVRTQ
jgi:hypothetical protein